MNLELQGVRAGYGSVEVLRGVDLVVPDGAAVALFGPNGAGKTTLLRTVAGLMTATSGRVRLGERDVTHARSNEITRAGLCLIPEGRGIFRRLTVRENIAMYVNGRRVGDAIATVADAFPILGERLGQQAGSMSGGQQQMLALSRALVTEPAVVLADELSLGLAPVIVDDIFRALARLKEQGTTILLVEQYVARALQFVDYVYILNKGEIVFVGEAAQCRDGSIFQRYLGDVA